MASLAFGEGLRVRPENLNSEIEVQVCDHRQGGAGCKDVELKIQGLTPKKLKIFLKHTRYMNLKLNLFSASDAIANILPCDGIAQYFGAVMPQAQANDYFNKLLHTIDWKNDEVMMFGKRIVTSRKTAWYGDKPFSYTYSKIARTALLWTSELVQLKQLAENLSGETYNSCLLNLYHHGGEGMGWHSDGEKEIVHHSAIASFSFGADRKFAFKHKHIPQTANVLLQHGSLLVMKGETQSYWLHKMPPTKKVLSPRINLTFRRMVNQ